MSLTEMRDCKLSLLTNFSTFLTKIPPNFSAEPQRIRVRAYGFGYLDYDKQHSRIPQTPPFPTCSLLSHPKFKTRPEPL